MWAGQRTLLLPGSEAAREGLRKLTETQLKLARMWEEIKYYHCTSWAVKIASGDYSDRTVIQWGISSGTCTTCHWGPWAPEQLSLLSSRDAGVTHRRDIPRQGLTAGGLEPPLLLEPLEHREIARAWVSPMVNPSFFLFFPLCIFSVIWRLKALLFV